MIVGIGTDIVAVARLEAMLQRQGDALIERLLSDHEREGLARQASPARFLARRFAAKEAMLKALGTGLREGIRWRDISIVHDTLGKPSAELRGQARERMEALGGTDICLTISDEQEYAVAFAIIEQR